MEILFDASLAEKEKNGRRIMRLEKHQCLMRLGHPVMRQAMATLCRQLHDPTSKQPIYRWSVSAMTGSGFEALIVYHFTLTAINQLREPLHDEVRAAVFRIEGSKLSLVQGEFAQRVLHAQLYPIKSAERREDWISTMRSHWYEHRPLLESFDKQQQQTWKSEFDVRAQRLLAQELSDTKTSYKNRLEELKDRSRDKEIEKLAKQLMEEQRGNTTAVFARRA